jgi:flotillin
MFDLTHIIPTAIALGSLVLIVVVLAIAFRIVVATNEVHIVQSRSKTISYGKDQKAGNSYYAWPAWVPLIGIRIIKLPVSVFDVQLNDYAAYDKGRVPFVIDILAFFRVEDSNVAAQRVSSFQELEVQLRGILQGASRSILAQSPIEEILEERAKYGRMFTDATNQQLKSWGVVNVKNIELMDIRDAQSSQVISRIMAIKQSLVERDSRVNVAKNKQEAQTAEIDAQRAVQVRQQEAEETVGVRTAQKSQQVGIADQQAQQAIKEQEKTTAEKAMAVLQVQEVRKAEITRGVQVVGADQERQTAVIRAEGEKQKTITVAEGNLEQAKLHAQGVEVEGKAKGEAEKAVLLAPVQAQITLAKEIGTNPGYQTYLVSIRQIEASQVVGIEQAKALTAAEIKVIANAGSPIDGVKSAMELLTPKGGMQIGAALEAFKNTDVGKAVVEALVNGGGAGSKAPPAVAPAAR